MSSYTNNSIKRTIGILDFYKSINDKYSEEFINEAINCLKSLQTDDIIKPFDKVYKSLKKKPETISQTYFDTLVKNGNTRDDIIKKFSIKTYLKPVLVNILTDANIAFSEKATKTNLAEIIYDLYAKPRVANIELAEEEEADEAEEEEADEAEEEKADEAEEEKADEAEEEKADEAEDDFSSVVSNEEVINKHKQEYVNKTVPELRKECRKHKIDFDKSDTTDELIHKLVEYKL